MLTKKQTMKTKGYRLLVCGGRDFEDEAAAFRALDAADALRPVELVIHGGEKGADALAARWAALRGRQCKVIRADWTMLGKDGAQDRNAALLSAGQPNGILALSEDSRTVALVRKARACGLPVWEPYRRIRRA